MHMNVVSVATPVCFCKKQGLWTGNWATWILFLGLILILYKLKECWFLPTAFILM